MSQTPPMLSLRLNNALKEELGRKLGRLLRSKQSRMQIFCNSSANLQMELSRNKVIMRAPKIVGKNAKKKKLGSSVRWRMAQASTPKQSNRGAAVRKAWRRASALLL